MRNWFLHWTISQKIVASFILLIVTDSVLLWLPISQAFGSQATYFDHFFHSASLVTVTGLVDTPIAQPYSFFGQIICLILMEIGGLGVMTIVASVVTAFGKRMSLSERLAVQEGLNREDTTDFRSFLSTILRYVFVIEGIGFLSFLFIFQKQA